MYIGIDLGGSHISAGLVNEEGKLIQKVSCPNDYRHSYEEFVESMAELCRKLIKINGASSIKSIGLGFPGSVNNEKGTVTSISSIKVQNAPIREEMKKYFDIPVFMENDANCAAYGEYLYGAAKGTKVSTTITIGTGIGVGIIIDGKIFSGLNYAASEQGHHVIVVEGERCNCGRRGCWEAYSSASALIKEAKTILDLESPFTESIMLEMVEGDYNKVEPKIIFEAAKKGDSIAIEIIRYYIKYLSEGIANVINSIMPEVLVIAGGISQQGDFLLELINKRVYQYIYTKNEPRTIMKIAELGTDAGLIGAASLGMKKD